LFNLAQTRAIAKSKDIAYVPKSNKTKIAIEAQGLTNGALAKGGLVSAIKPEQRTDGKIVISGPSIIKETNKFHTTPVLKQLFPHKWQDTSTFSTNIIKQVNRGQITTYPFKIEKQIYISDTHYQPYQLDLNEDLDKDGESDIIVWYTLGLADYAENNEKMMGNMYRLSPKDVRNNYYIYTKGNITYSGVGHSKVTKDDERKLYINTLVAAYKSAAVAPDVIFKESEKPDSAEKSVSYVSYDVLADATNNGSIEDKVRAYFIPTDENDLIRNIKEDETRILVSVASSGAVSSGFIKPEYDIFKADGTNTKITDKARDKEGNEFFVLEKGKVYYLEIPVSELGEKNKLELNVTARTRFTKSYKVATGTAPVYDYSPMGTSTYIIQKRGLFDLD